MSDHLIARLEALAGLGEGVDACPYLPDRVATFQFLDGAIAPLAYRQLLDHGYRRCGTLLYRPVCSACQACEVLRVPVAQFTPSKSQRRAARRGDALFTTVCAPAELTPEKLALYRRYLAYQHGEEDAETEADAYQAFLVDSCLGEQTFEVQLRDGDRLAGVGIVDRLPDALSSVYFYFDPDYARLSPGTYSVLIEIRLAREWGLAWYYPGYYIEDCPAMNYKAAFRPCARKTCDAAAWQRLPARR